MDSLNPSLEFILERARATDAVMAELAAAPHNWYWTGISPNNFSNVIDGVDGQLEVQVDADTAVTAAAAAWDLDLDKLLADAALGLRLARVQFKADPVKFQLFEGLRFTTLGRDARYRQALEFESAWERADPAWTYNISVNPPVTITLAAFKTRRQAIRTREEAHVAAGKNEQHERALLNSMATGLNDLSVDWYDVATATFAEDTVAGQLVRTIPTTYDPNQPPGVLEFTEHFTPAPNMAHLVWRASRGQKYYISAQAPGAPGFTLILDGATETEWMGQAMAPGLWRFQGHATNQHGQGPTSVVVELTVGAAQAA